VSINSAVTQTALVADAWTALEKKMIIILYPWLSK
jgi:hypothetical protein